MTTAKLVACLRVDFPSLTVYATLQFGGGEMIVIAVPRTSVVVKVVSSPNKFQRYDLYNTEGDCLSQRLEPTEITPMVRLSLRKLAEV